MSAVADPTMALVESLKKGSKRDWGKIIDNVPTFVAHKWFERTVDGYKEARTVLPGEEPPDPKEGWVFVYEVTEKDLDTVVEQINKNFEKRATPMKLLVGHSRPGQPQEYQPQLVGFGIDAKIGHYGPDNIRCVQTRMLFKKGFEDVAAEYPQRSPEYKASAKNITGIALLKTDPRLPLGFHAYGSNEDLYFYGVGEMADEKKEPEEKPDAKPAEKPAESTEKPAEKPAAAAPATPAAPAAPAAGAAPEVTPLEPHEAHFANRLMKHYAETCPPMKHLHEQYKQYEASQAAMAAASPTSGRTPATPIGAETGTEKDELMQDEETVRQYEERIAALELDRANMYADAQITELRSKQRVKIRDPKKFKEKLVAAKMKSDADAQAVLDDALQNYAREERAPVGRDFLPIERNSPTDGPKDSDELDLQEPEVIDGITRYAEENKINVQTDEGWDKAVEGYAAAKKKKIQRQTA